MVPREDNNDIGVKEIVNMIAESITKEATRYKTQKFNQNIQICILV